MDVTSGKKTEEIYIQKGNIQKGIARTNLSGLVCLQECHTYYAIQLAWKYWSVTFDIF